VSRGGALGRAALVALATVAADQAVKAIVRSSIRPTETVDVFPGVHLVNVRNTGVAFSVLSGGGALPLVIGLLAVGALLAFFLTHLTRPLVWLPTGLLLGGAAGNLLDRVRAGSVTDFIKLPDWPAFNVADMSITFGVLALLWVLEGRREPDRQATSPDGH
jgi:signal peptidase II